MATPRSRLVLVSLLLLAGALGLLWYLADAGSGSLAPTDAGAATAEGSGAAVQAPLAGAAEADIAASQPAREALTASLQRPTGIRGRVLDGKTLAPVAGVEVVAMRDLPGFERLVSRFRGLIREGLWKDSDTPVQVLGSTTSAADGTFEILGLPPGRVFVDGRSDRIYVRTPGSVRLALGEISEGMELLGSPGGRIRGEVKGPDGLPLSGAAINLRPGLNAFLGQITQRKYRWLETRSDAEGRFDIPGVPTGSGYALSATHKLSALAEVTGLNVVEGQTTIVQLLTSAGARITGHVVDGAGQPVRGANVAMVYLDLTRVLFSADGRDEPIATDDQGAFVLDHVAPGRVAFIAAAEGRAPSGIEERAIVEGGSYDDLVLTLGEGRVLSGLVVDDQNRPLADASVEVRPMERPTDPDVLKMALKIRTVTVKTAGDGRFEARGLSGERLMLAAMKPGYVSEVRFGVKLEERDVRLVLTRGVTVAGKVQVADGTPLQRFRVEARSRPANQPPEENNAEVASSRPSGEFRFEIGAGRGRRGREFNEGSFRMRDGQRLLDQNPESGWEDVLSADGTFAVHGVPPGNVRVRVRADGYRDPERQEVTLAAGERSKELLFTIEPGAVARGIVVDATSGLPIAQAQVTAHRSRNQEDGERRGPQFRFNIDAEDFDFLGMSSLDGRRSALTDSKGQFTVDGLNPGKYRFTARHPDLAKSSSADVDVVADRPTDGIEIRLGSGGGIEGVVTGALQRPLNDALVVAFSLSAGAFKSTTSDPNGFFRIEGLVPGQYIVFKSRMEERSMNLGYDLLGNMRLKTVAVRDGRFTRADIHDESEDGVRVYGVVRDGLQIVPRAMVTALSSDREGPFGIGVRAKPTDAQGNYELAGLKPGTYFFQVSRFQREPQQASLSIEVPSGVREYRIDLEIPQSSISGRVVDSTGAPVAGIQVAAGVLEGGPANAEGLLGLILKNGVNQARTDAEGRFRLQSVAAGTYRVTASGRQGRRELRKYGEAALEGVLVDGRTPVADLELRLPLAGSLLGLVLDGSGNPVAGAEIHYERDRKEKAAVADPQRALADLFGVQMQPARSGADGRFTIEGVTPGTYRVRADAKGLAPGVADDVVVLEARPTTVELMVIRGAVLRARVTNIDGSKLPLADITLLDGKGKPLASRVSVVSVFRALMGDEQKKDDSGWHEIGNVPPDTYTVIVREKGKPELKFTRAIKDGETAEWDIDMAAEAKKLGR